MPCLIADNKSLLASTCAFGGSGVSLLCTLMLDSEFEVVSDVEDGDIVGCAPTEDSDGACFKAFTPF